MTHDQVAQLHAGDEVCWTDPDDGACSRVLMINVVTVNGDVVQITDTDGGYLECYAEELS